MSYAPAGLRIRKFLLHETGTYNQQYRRPYNTTLTGGTLNVLAERLDGSNTYEPSIMGGIANQFISPSPTPESTVSLANGWNERRMRFMMEVETISNMGTSTLEVVLGYTNYNGVLATGVIDPQMEFFVNSTMQIRDTMNFTPLGNQVFSSVSDASHILVDNRWEGILSPVKEQRMRPEDVYSTMSRSLLHSGGGAVYDGRAMSTTTAVKSRRTNASAANYMSKLLSGYQHASAIREMGEDQASMFSKARRDTAENLVSLDPFLSAIGQIRGTGIGNTFTFSNLRQIDPNVENVTRAQLMAPTSLASAHQTGQTAEWGGSDLYTTTASILSQAIPSILMELALTRIVFKTTNRNINSGITTVIMDAQGFSTGDISQYLDIFKIRLEHEILLDISFHNSFDFAIEMRVDLLGETWINISLEGKAPADFVTPSFCDALLVPVITTNDQLAMNLASDFEQLSLSLADIHSQKFDASPLGNYRTSGI